MPSESSATPKVKRATPELTSVPIMPISSPSTTIASALSIEPCASTTAAISPSTISEKYSAGPNLKRDLGQRRGEPGDQQGGHGAGEERADRGDRQCRPGAAVARHLVAVQGGDHRRDLAGQVDQDRGGRAAVLRAVVDARSMISAVVGSLSLKVIGSSIAIVASGPMPGSTPISVPSSTPMKQ